MWVICGGCPLTKMTNKTKDDRDFVCRILTNIFPDMTNQKADHIIGLYFVSIIFIAHYRLTEHEN